MGVDEFAEEDVVPEGEGADAGYCWEFGEGGLAD